MIGVVIPAHNEAEHIFSPDWLVNQLALEAEVVCGSIAVDDWGTHGRHGEFLRGHFSRTYTDADGHRGRRAGGRPRVANLTASSAINSIA